MVLIGRTNSSVLVSCPRNRHMFRRGSVGCFSRRSEPDWRLRRAYLESIRKERATRKNSQLATAQRLAVKTGPAARWLVGNVPIDIRALFPPVRLGPPCRRPILIATEHMLISGTGH